MAMSDSAALGGRQATRSRGDSTPRRGGVAGAAALDRPGLIMAFMLAAVIPLIFNLGPLRLTPIRLLLIAMFLPLLFGWIGGKYGGIKKPDVLIILYCFWMSLALLANHGFSRIEFIGISVIEALTPYLLARSAIRTAEGFRYFMKIFFYILLGLLPIVVIESLTNRLIVNEVLRIVGTFPNAPLNPRWGLQRAQGTFEHPILYGVFCSAGFGLLWYGFGPQIGKGRGMIGAAVSGATTFFSLSMGAWVSLMTQIMLIGWDRVIRAPFRRWRQLLILSTLAYISVDLISNRTPFHVFIDYLTFSQGNAYNRILIFRFGMENVWDNPILGLGLNDWERAFWMSSSMDNFWLVQAVRYGIPGFLFLTGAFGLMAYRIGMLEIPDPDAARYRKGLLIALGGVAMAICTVHLWNASFCFLMFLLGSGAWMLDQGWPSGFKPSDDSEGVQKRRGSGSGQVPAQEASNSEPVPSPKPAAPSHSALMSPSGPVRPRLGGRAGRSRSG